MSKQDESNPFKSCLANIVIIIVAAALLIYLFSFNVGEEEQVEYAWYEVKYIHLSGETKIKHLSLDAEGINLEVGFCNGSYFIFDDAHDDKHDCNVRRLIYGATDIISFQKIKE